MDNADVLQWMIWISGFAILGLIFFCYIIWQRRQYSNMSEGNILVDMYQTNGTCPELMCPFDGYEVFVHKEAKKIRNGKGDHADRAIPRYFADKDSISLTVWPHKTGLMRMLTSVQVPKVAFFEGCPEPISQRRKWQVVSRESLVYDDEGNIADIEECSEVKNIDEGAIVIWDDRKIIGTPELLGVLRDERFALFSALYNEEIENLKQQLQKALSTRIEPRWIYLSLFAGVIFMGVCGYLMYNILGNIDKISKGLGI